ncbi:MAG: bi-domain-containing oxidoreductase [Acidobacteria bacterium]|nr:bi-domain-containing oxidoreductase [Acidobacteriota bacterium]
MKQVVQNFRTGELAVEELPPPALKVGGLLVETAYSLISAGTERSIVETAQSSLVGKARSRPDLVRQVLDTFKREGLRATYEKVQARLNQIKALGYSASGTVIAVGEGVSGFQVGDRVACAGAGYASHAEFLFVPQNLCCKLPADAHLEAACYTTVGAIALQGIRQADVRLGETVAVIGLGLVGQLTVQMLKASGCRVLGFDIDAAACELAKQAGADGIANNPEAARQYCAAMTEGRGADSILITASTTSDEPVELASELARDRARITAVGMIGMNIPRNAYYLKELEIRLSRSYGPGRYDPVYEEQGVDYPLGYVRWTEKRNMEAFLQLIAAGKVNTDLLTTHRFQVKQATEAYRMITGKAERYCGIVLAYPHDEQAVVNFVKTTHQKPPAKNALGVSFIGAGNFARGVLLPLVKRTAQLNLEGIATATGISAKNTAEMFGFRYSTTDTEQIFGNEKSDCVFIATRHDNHAALSAEALRRGKNVFVEKPLATTLEGLREVIGAARESNHTLMVGYNRRFAPLAVELKKAFANRVGALTILYRVNAGQLAAEHWSHDQREGGGRIIGEVCHFIDFAQFLTDALPVQVSAVAVPVSRKAGFVDDSVSASMSFADGSIATIVYTASGNNAVAKERVEIFGDRVVAVLDDFKSAEIHNGKKTVKLGGGAQQKGHAEEIAAFLAAASGKQDAPIALASLAATSLACLAIIESAKTGTACAIDLNLL